MIHGRNATTFLKEVVLCLLWYHFLKLEAEKAVTGLQASLGVAEGFHTSLALLKDQQCRSGSASHGEQTAGHQLQWGAHAGTCFFGKTTETNCSSSEGQKNSKSFSILQQTDRYFCHKLTYNQWWFDTLTALGTDPQRKNLADYSLRCTVNSSLHFMQTAFPYRIFIFNLIGNYISTHFCKHLSIKFNKTMYALHESLQNSSTDAMDKNSLCCLRHLSFHRNCSVSSPDLQCQFHSQLCGAV